MQNVQLNPFHDREAILVEEAKKPSTERQGYPLGDTQIGAQCLIQQALDLASPHKEATTMHSETTDAASVLDVVIRSRKSVRAFRPDPVPRHQLMEILDAACAAPSNFNSQPWRVYLLTGKVKRALGEAILQAHLANTLAPFSPFPQPTPPDCEARLNDFGTRYYSALGIDRADLEARTRQTGRNFVFFDAPVGLIFTIHAKLTKHSWLDYGLFLQNLMLAAHVRGLATCPQVAFVRYQSIIAEQLGLGPEEFVACGMSCGYADEQAVVNRMNMPREPVERFTSWLGFDE
jgi:nitroreductase